MRLCSRVARGSQLETADDVGESTSVALDMLIDTKDSVFKIRPHVPASSTVYLFWHNGSAWVPQLLSCNHQYHTAPAQEAKHPPCQ